MIFFFLYWKPIEYTTKKIWLVDFFGGRNGKKFLLGLSHVNAWIMRTDLTFAIVEKFQSTGALEWSGMEWYRRKVVLRQVNKMANWMHYNRFDKLITAGDLITMIILYPFLPFSRYASLGFFPFLVLAFFWFFMLLCWTSFLLTKGDNLLPFFYDCQVALN